MAGTGIGYGFVVGTLYTTADESTELIADQNKKQAKKKGNHCQNQLQLLHERSHDPL